MSLIGDLTNAGVNLGLGIANIASTKRNVRKTNETNLQIAQETNAQNQKNWQAEFDYQKYLNENQYQIQAKDQTKAGINPIAANGGTLQAYSGNTNTASAAQMQQADYSRGFEMLENVFSQIRALKHDSKEREKDRENAKKIAEINAEANKYGSDTSSEASKYSSDVQAAIAAENRKTQKQIADDNRAAQKAISNLDRQSREKIAGWSNETQKAIQKAQQEWTDSDDHREAAKKLQKALEEAYDYGRELEAMKHLYITADTGEKYRIDDYLKMLEADARAYENSPTRRSENAIYRGLDRLISVFNTVTGAATRTR